MFSYLGEKEFRFIVTFWIIELENDLKYIELELVCCLLGM